MIEQPQEWESAQDLGDTVDRAISELTNISISSRSRPQQSPRKLARQNAFVTESDHCVQASGASSSTTTSSTTCDDGDDWIVVQESPQKTHAGDSQTSMMSDQAQAGSPVAEREDA